MWNTMLGSVQDIWAGIVARMQTAANSLESDFDDIRLHNEDTTPSINCF